MAIIVGRVPQKGDIIRITQIQRAEYTNPVGTMGPIDRNEGLYTVEFSDDRKPLDMEFPQVVKFITSVTPNPTDGKEVKKSVANRMALTLYNHHMIYINIKTGEFFTGQPKTPDKEIWKWQPTVLRRR